MKDAQLVQGRDMRILDTVVFKAENLFKVQEGSLYYAQEFGLDLALFLDPDLQFQNETFDAYCVRRMAEVGISVTDIAKESTTLQELITYTVTESTNKGRGLIE